MKVTHLTSLFQLTFKLLACAVLGMAAVSVQAAVSNYTITSNNSYIRERNDVNTGLPVVIDARTSLTGTLAVDTATGELISATIALGDYSESYDWNPLGLPFVPHSGSADLQYTGETQILTGGLTGTVSGTVISFSGVNAWSGASTLGSVSCTNPVDALGADVCANAAVSPWSPFDIDLEFSADFSMFSASTRWTDSDSLTANAHQLDIFAVREVPLPAAAWLMLSALGALSAVKRSKRDLR